MAPVLLTATAAYERSVEKISSLEPPLEVEPTEMLLSELASVSRVMQLPVPLEG